MLPPMSEPLIVTTEAEIETGSRPAYVIALPSSVMEPEWAPLGFDTTVVPVSRRLS